MRPHPNPRRPARRRLVHVATGYGIRIRVERGQLIVEDGVGRARQTTTFNRATGGLGRLLLLGSTGYISLDALRWMTDANCGFIHLDHNGRLLAASTGLGSDNPALRRAQALAATNPIGVDICRNLLAVKLSGQRELAVGLDADAAATISRRIEDLADCDTLNGLRLLESQAAAAYWAAWRGVQVQFTTRDLHRVPVHWTGFSQRASVLTGSPRVAVDPICAVLNYLYAILEVESRIALLAVGLDPGVGILHTDQPARDSLALDVMEAARPAVDAYVLRLIAERPFSLKDVHETQIGQCRLLPRLATELAHTASAWAMHVAPQAESIAALLMREPGRKPTTIPLTQAGNRRGARLTRATTRARSSARRPTSSTCLECGESIPVGHVRCTQCHGIANAERLRAQQAAETARRRARKQYPSQDSSVRQRIAASQHIRWEERKARGAVSGFTGQPSEFQRLILPRLAGLRPTEIAREIGLSPGYCGQILSGARVPHVRHWAELQLLGLQRSEGVRTPSAVSSTPT